jgi:hypothetical protein
MNHELGYPRRPTPEAATLSLAVAAEVRALRPEAHALYGTAASNAGLAQPAVDLVLQLVAANLAIKVPVLLVS